MMIIKLKLKYLIILMILEEVVNGSAVLENKQENTIGTCERFDVCNIVHRPYFGKFAVEKLCLCPENTFCPATFGNDSRSLLVNSRTQMKFCHPVQELLSELPECEEGKESLEIMKFYFINEVKNISTKLLCNCDKHPVYWKHHSRLGEAVPENDKLFKTFDYFECAPLRKCNTNEFCGLARTDYGFIFQRCTCNMSDDCRYYVEETDIEENVEELFYNELFWKAHCLRKESVTDW